jgi:pimeloyl-ACP methyl ester carboxylesterase
VELQERTVVSIPAGDGRALEVVLAGPPDGVPLVFFHGTPGAAGPFAALVDAGAERGLRHVAYSRPGYGASDRHPGRSVADCVADVVAIADALGHDRFYCSGGSGGGPHSIACAALIPDRVIGVAAIATPAPVDAEGLDWTAGMGEENLEESSAARAGERRLQDYLEREAEAVNGAEADDLLRVWHELFCEADRRALSGAYAEHTLRQIERSLASGIWGWFDDDMALVSAWGFELGRVAAPVDIWHGG